ncbi:AAA family ATPase, partial [Rhizobium johnstonii]|uniref:AAA family ATPase n=1 Tax=Rhizobium johnstonii TaxID=3019933 RepID=UPI003F973CCF
MRIAHLSLTDYRNYATASVDFAPGANLIVGRNGQGKTNMVEAIGYLATLGSHRVASDGPLIRAGVDAAIIRARLQS